MASHETVDLQVDGGAGRILLNRPESLNAWNEQFGRDLLDAVQAVSADESVRAVMITGAGRAFSSGADLKEQRGADGGGNAGATAACPTSAPACARSTTRSSSGSVRCRSR